jgi:hypothetical protein
MSTESELMQKQREIRDEILALKETIPSARIFNRLGKLFTPKGLILNIVFLNLIATSPMLLLGLVLKEAEKLISVYKYVIILTAMGSLGFIVVYIAVQVALNGLAKRIVEKINNTDDLFKLLLWIKQFWSTKNLYPFVITACFIWALLAAIGFSAFLKDFVGFGFLLWCIIAGLLGGAGLYDVVWLILLTFRLAEYEYEMNAFSPADSEIINDISEMFKTDLYILAGLEFVFTLTSTSTMIEQQARTLIGLPIVAIGWTLIVTQFLLTRSTLKTITNRAKWKTLNRIRVKINTIETASDLSDKDAAERLFRLADIHKQIMASRTNTFDLKSASTLFSQLMLPLLGLLLGNLKGSPLLGSLLNTLNGLLNSLP